MLMNYWCPGCGNSMEFSPADRKMYCICCGSSYTVEEWNAISGLPAGGETINAAPAAAGTDPDVPENMRQENGPEEDVSRKMLSRRRATIPMQILHCNGCGAELAVNGVESSSFCIYCGQATVVTDRVEDYLQPDHIIPFRVTKEQAESIIRNKVRQGRYIPDEVKHFRIETLRGIYIPFWLYDIYFGADQFWKYAIKKGKNTEYRFEHRTGDCVFKKMTLDASKSLLDESSQRLEPYDLDDLQPFDPAYLSGFYSDRFDMGTDDLDGLACRRAEELFNAEMKANLQHKAARLESSVTVKHIMKREYALLPVWFLTFRYENRPYTILLNGQTGKMVGALPVVKKKVYWEFAVMAVLFCAVLATLGVWLTPLFMGRMYTRDDGGLISMFLTVVGTSIYWPWYVAVKKYKEMKISLGLTRSGSNTRLARERAGK